MSALLLNNTVVFLLNRMHEIFFSLSLKFLKMVQWFLAVCWNFFCMYIITLIDQGSVVFICWNACTHTCWFKFGKIKKCIILSMHYIAGVNESTIFMALLSKCVVFLYNNLSNKYHSMEEYVTDLWFQN